MEYQIPKGLFDIVPNDKDQWKESDKWQYLESVIKKLAKDYNFEEIRTPIFEKTNLFVRSSGDSSDIVTKELYSFLDKASRSMSLRPEGTASIARSVMETKLYADKKQTKLFYIGPMFRYDRPQKGRYRQHHQFGVEFLGSKGYEADAELIDMLMQLFKRLEIQNIKLMINSIGDLESRHNYKKALIKYLEPNFNELSADSQKRLNINPLRVLDSKEEKDIRILKNAPSILDFLSNESEERFKKLLKLLDELKIDYEINPRLVRGLDYYDNTVFEVVLRSISGAQNALGGGGRYNTLFKHLGGVDLPAVGFACGLERILQTMLEQNCYFPKKPSPFIFVVPLCEKAKIFGIKLTKELRHHKIPTEIDLDANKIQKSLKLASKINAHNAIILGENEMDKKVIQIKDLNTRTQSQVKFEDMYTFIKNMYYKK